MTIKLTAKERLALLDAQARYEDAVQAAAKVAEETFRAIFRAHGAELPPQFSADVARGTITWDASSKKEGKRQ